MRAVPAAAEAAVMNKAVVLGMSGGVDSSYAASLLKKEGYNVLGAFCVMHEYAEAGLADAKRAADTMGIELYTVDLTEEFDRKVKSYFAEAYAHAETPNPCIICNPEVKFKALINLADKLGAEKIATGHYAGIGKDEETGRYFVKKSSSKDQSYMLCRLTQDELSRTLFPLYGTDKKDNRKAAAAEGIPVAEKPDSQEICFIPDNDYAAFIEKRAGKFPQGEFWLTDENKAVGTHNGLIHYTVGQRKNLGIALGTPAYVCGFDKEKNRVLLSRNDVTDFRGLNCADIAYQKLSPEASSFTADVKIRYAHKGVSVSSEKNADGFRAIFAEPQRAVTPGQAAVFYEDDGILCAGEIKNAF